MIILRLVDFPLVRGYGGVIDLVCRVYSRIGDVTEHSSFHINKIEAALHAGGHAFRKFKQTFPDVLQESCAASSAHFLDLPVFVAGKCQGICSPTP